MIKLNFIPLKFFSLLFVVDKFFQCNNTFKSSGNKYAYK